jgi:hypothetical protein
MTTVTKAEMIVYVSYPVTKQRISDLLCSAFEGGSNYWYIIAECVEPPVLEFRTSDKTIFKHLDYPLNDGGGLLIGDQEDEDRQPILLDFAAIRKGLTLLAEKYPRHWADFLSENDDASTADVFLQLCLFGEVVYD